MRWSVATVSLPTLTPAEAAPAIAAAGFAGVEWRVAEGDVTTNPLLAGHPYKERNRCTLAPTMPDAVLGRRLAEAAGLEVCGLAPYLRSDDRAGIEQALRMAVAAGAPQIRLQAPRPSGSTRSYRALRDATARALAGAEPLALAHGVRIALEIHHNTICPSASLAAAMVEPLDPRAVGVIYDVGNLVREGYEDHAIAFALLAGRITHVHLKNAAHVRGDDGRWRYAWRPLDDGIVDVPDVLGRLAATGYAGWVSVEDLSEERAPAAALEHNAACLRRWGAPGFDQRPVEA